jgi:hypothetical protein
MEQELDAEHHHHQPHGQPQRHGDCIGAIGARGQGAAHGQADRQPDPHHQGIAGDEQPAPPQPCCRFPDAVDLAGHHQGAHGRAQSQGQDLQQDWLAQGQQPPQSAGHASPCSHSWPRTRVDPAAGDGGPTGTSPSGISPRGFGAANGDRITDGRSR